VIRLSLVVVLSVLFTAMPAQAQLRNSSVQVANDDGWYIGGSWGQFDLHLSGLGDFGHGFSEVFKSEDNVWKAFAGYRFNPYAALEGAYVKLGGRTELGNGNANSGYVPSLVITIPDGGWELFGKLGYYLYSGSSDLTYGMGFGYTFSGRFNLSFDYQIIKMSGVDTDALWINGSYRF